MSTVNHFANLKVGGKKLLVGGVDISVPNWRDAKHQQNQFRNWDQYGVDIDRNGSGELLFYDIRPTGHFIGVDPDNGDLTGSTFMNGTNSDGRGVLYTETGQSDVTLELDVVILDQSQIKIAMPITPDQPPIVPDGGIWYIGYRTVANLILPLVCVVDDEDSATPSYGLAPWLEPQVYTADGITTAGAFVVWQFNNGVSSEQIIMQDPEGANYIFTVANSDMPDPGDILTYRVNVTGNLLNCWVDGLKVDGVKTDNVHVFADCVIPAEMVGATKHGITGQFAEGAHAQGDFGGAKAPYRITY